MRCAVTGGAGFIGRAVCHELVDRGHKPIIIDREHGINIMDDGSLYDGTVGCDAVIHMAGVLGTSELFDNPYTAVRVNVEGTLNVLEACRAHKMAYVGITMPRVWENVYQATKQCAMNFAEAWRLHHKVPVSHVRAFNVFGPGQKLGPVQKIIPTFATRAWRGLPIPIWGDGTQTVDLVYVDHVARMLVDALDYGEGQVFDAGTGIALTVNEVAQMVLDYTGSKGGIEYLPMRKGEHETKIVAEGEGWNLLGWHPIFRPLDLHDTLDSYKPGEIRAKAA